MKKMLVLDMDGTIADLYNVDKWLTKLLAEDETPYTDAKPLFDMELLTELLNVLKDLGWIIAVTSWLCKNGTKTYNEKVTAAKTAWLKKYNFPVDILNIVEYGTLKNDCTINKADYQVLVDDDANVRKMWTLGDTIQPKDLIKFLIDTIEKEVFEKIDKYA